MFNYAFTNYIYSLFTLGFTFLKTSVLFLILLLYFKLKMLHTLYTDNYSFVHVLLYFNYKVTIKFTIIFTSELKN